MNGEQPDKVDVEAGASQGFWVVVVGLLVVLVSFVVAVLRFDQAADAATALGPVTPVVGTLVGAYFVSGDAGRGRRGELLHLV